ncbi:hypothetical protein ACXDE0_002977, partial [Shigella flexneri]
SGEKRVFLVILFTSFSGSLVSRIPGAVQYAIAGLCQNHKKAGWESSGCSTRQKWKTRAG